MYAVVAKDYNDFGLSFDTKEEANEYKNYLENIGIFGIEVVKDGLDNMVQIFSGFDFIKEYDKEIAHSLGIRLEE